MTEQTDRALIAEVRERREKEPTQTSDGPLLDRLADALEARLPHPDEDEREALSRIISDAEDQIDEEGSWALPEDVADAILEAGFSRSRLPRVVDREELIGELRRLGMGGGLHEPLRQKVLEEWADHLIAFLTPDSSTREEQS